MEIENFRELISRLEILENENRGKYRFKVFLLACLGFAYIGFMLFLAVAAAVIAVVIVIYGKKAVLIKFVFIPVGFAYMIFKSLWVRMSPPEGRELKRDECPLLFEEIENVRKSLNSQPIDHIIVSDELNAAVAKVPRLGFFGWNKNYLILGLPLLAALDLEQFRTVLAHEFGHHSKDHTRFGNWIYRLRITWDQLLSVMNANRSFATGLFTKFFNWYAPYFDAYTFVFARSNEYEADKVAASLVNARAAGDALVNISIKADFMGEHYWKPLYDRVSGEPEPPSAVISALLEKAKGVPREEAAKCLEGTLAIETGIDDTHPALKDRLAALNLSSPSVPPALERSAAEALLDDFLGTIAKELDEAWKASIFDSWQMRHAYVNERKIMLEKHEIALKENTITNNELLDYATAIEEVEGYEAARPIYKKLLDRDPDNLKARYAYGRALLMEKNEEGVGHLEKAMESSYEYVESGREILYSYFYSRGDSTYCDKFEGRLKEVRAINEMAQLERNELHPKDRFKSHGLTMQELERLEEVMSRELNIKRSYLVRKEVEYYPDEPLYCMAIEIKGFIYDKNEFLKELLQKLRLEGFLYLFVGPDDRKNFKKVKGVEGSLIYDYKMRKARGA